MSLTKDDLDAISEILEYRIKPLENDIKEIYYMLARFERKTDKNFAAIAKHLDIELPYPSIN